MRPARPLANKNFMLQILGWGRVGEQSNVMGFQGSHVSELQSLNGTQEHSGMALCVINA